MSNFSMYDYMQRMPEQFDTHDWATPEEVSRYGTEDELCDVILGANAHIAPHYTERPFEYAINNNVFFLGGSGAAKTTSGIIPNLLNHRPVNYVITDTKGEISKMTADGFKKDGFEVITLDTINIANSNGYDPLRYVKTDEDIVAFCSQLYRSLSSGEVRHSSDPFWDDSAELFLRLNVGALRDLELVDGVLAPGGDENAPRRYLTMNNLLELTQMICITESNDGEGSSPLDYFFKGLTEGGIDEKIFDPMPRAYSVTQFNDFRVAAARTLKSIVITLTSLLTKLRGTEMQQLFAKDEMRFHEIGTGKRVFILKMSDCDSSKTFLARIALKQLIQQAFKAADATKSGELERPVQFVLDEFPNVGRIPDFPRIIATARSRGMSFLMCAQSLSQIRGIYGTEGECSILDNCDSIVYMGSGSSIETSDYISRLCGTTQIGNNLQGIEGTKRALYDKVITASEVSQLPRTECIVKISGCKPFRTAKYNGFTHPNAKKFLKPLKPIKPAKKAKGA